MTTKTSVSSAVSFMFVGPPNANRPWLIMPELDFFARKRRYCPQQNGVVAQLRATIGSAPRLVPRRSGLAGCAYDQNAVRIDAEPLAGKDDGRGAELLDDRRAGKLRTGAQRGAFENRRVAEFAFEIARPAPAFRRIAGGTLNLRNARTIDHAEAGHA